MNTSSSSSIGLSEISDYNQEVGFFGQEQAEFFAQQSAEWTEWDNVCANWEKEEVARREAELAISDEDWVISMSGWFGF
jgi:hypothetical protein